MGEETAAACLVVNSDGGGAGRRNAQELDEMRKRRRRRRRNWGWLGDSMVLEEAARGLGVVSIEKAVVCVICVQK